MFSKDAYSTKYHSYFSRANNRRNLTGFVYQKATNSKPLNSLKRRALAKTKHGTANNLSTYLRIFIVKHIVWQISHRQTPDLFLVTFDIAVWRTWCLYVFHIRLHSEDNQITFRMKNPMTKYEVIRSMNSLNKLSTSKEFRKEFYAIYVFSGLDRYDWATGRARHAGIVQQMRAWTRREQTGIFCILISLIEVIPG